MEWSFARYSVLYDAESEELPTSQCHISKLSATDDIVGAEILMCYFLAHAWR